MKVPIQAVSEDEIGASLQEPAIFCNRFFISIGPVVRVAFAEQAQGVGKDLNFRSAVALSHADAIALQHVLAEMLKPIEEQIDAAFTGQPEGFPDEK